MARYVKINAFFTQEWTFTEMKQIRNEGHGTLCLTMDGQLQGKRKLILFQNCNNVNIKQVC